MKMTTLKFKQRSEELALDYIAQGVAAVKQLPVYSEFKLSSTILDWSPRRVSSRGGWYPKRGGAGISIAMKIAATNTCNSDIIRVYEYSSFDADAHIGGFYTRKPELKLFLHCIHEVAHAAQFWGKCVLHIEPGKPHGDIWKHIYKHLRVKLLNEHIEPQEPLSAEYKKFISHIDSSYFKIAASRA
jgi:hypothetical protein